MCMSDSYFFLRFLMPPKTRVQCKCLDYSRKRGSYRAKRVVKEIASGNHRSKLKKMECRSTNTTATTANRKRRAALAKIGFLIYFAAKAFLYDSKSNQISFIAIPFRFPFPCSNPFYETAAKQTAQRFL